MGANGGQGDGLLTRERAAALGILVLVYTFNFIDRQIVGILAVPIKADLGLSDTQLGLMGGLAFALFYTGPAPLEEATLAGHAAARLARYKQPRLYRHLPALPRGANNKLNRRALRALGPEAPHDPS